QSSGTSFSTRFTMLRWTVPPNIGTERSFSFGGRPSARPSRDTASARAADDLIGGLLLAPDGAQPGRGLGHHVQHAGRGDGGGPDLGDPAHVDLADELLLLAVLEDVDLALLVAHVDVAVDPVGRTPRVAPQVVVPDLLARLRVEAEEHAVEVGRVAQPF